MHLKCPLKPLCYIICFTISKEPDCLLLVYSHWISPCDILLQLLCKMFSLQKSRQYSVKRLWRVKAAFLHFHGNNIFLDLCSELHYAWQDKTSVEYIYASVPVEYECLVIGKGKRCTSVRNTQTFAFICMGLWYWRKVQMYNPI